MAEIRKVRFLLPDGGLIALGDIVCLRSGGVNMTVAEFGSDGTIFCMWYNPVTGGISDRYFLPEMLEIMPRGRATRTA